MVRWAKARSHRDSKILLNMGRQKVLSNPPNASTNIPLDHIDIRKLLKSIYNEVTLITWASYPEA